MKFWGFKVGRGLLMNAGEGVNFAFVDRAFGGLGTAKIHDEGRLQEEIDPEEVEEVVDSVTLVRQHGISRAGSVSSEDRMHIDNNGHLVENTVSPSFHQGTTQAEGVNSDEEVILMGDLHDEIADRLVEHDEQGGHSDSDDDGEDDDSDEDGDDDDGEITSEERQFMWQSALQRRKLREQVQAHVPCSPHTRQYGGHCNVKTVKDVNYFGLQDEYVVSGSDSGHLFIWDKKSTQLVNILEGDGEVVNVVQGPPQSSHSSSPGPTPQSQELTHPHRPPLRTPPRRLRHRPHHQDFLARRPRPRRCPRRAQPRRRRHRLLGLFLPRRLYRPPPPTRECGRWHRGSG